MSRPQKKSAASDRVASGKLGPRRKTSLGERLQKVLASAGVGSRRECEALIEEGRVDVDRQVVTELGTRVFPEKQQIRVDGVRISLARRLYFAVNKPPGVISTSSDPTGRLRVIDLLGTDQRVFTVGRLDKSSEGLIIVTNDGEFANRLTHPKFGVNKTYHVQVAGQPERQDLEMLTQGVHLAEGFAKAEEVKVRTRRKKYTELSMVLSEGRNREIRRLLARIGHKVLRLKRVAIGPLKMGDLPAGAHRKLTHDEVRALARAASGSPPRKKQAVSSRSSAAASPRPARPLRKKAKKRAYLGSGGKRKPASPGNERGPKRKPKAAPRKASPRPAAGPRGAAKKSNRTKRRS